MPRRSPTRPRSATGCAGWAAATARSACTRGSRSSLARALRRRGAARPARTPHGAAARAGRAQPGAARAAPARRPRSPGADPQRLRARRRARHAQRGAGARARARALPRHRRRRPSPGRGALRPGRVRRRAARRRARARRGGPHRASRSCACGARTGGSPGSTRPTARSTAGTVGARRGHLDARARGARSASTSRSRPPRATTSRSTRRALQAGIPIYMEQSRVIATPLGGRLRLAGTLELAGHDLRVDPVRLDSLLRAARRTLRSRPARGPSRSGAGCGRARRTGCRSSGASTASRTSFWPPRMPCSGSRWRP